MKQHKSPTATPQINPRATMAKRQWRRKSAGNDGAETGIIFILELTHEIFFHLRYRINSNLLQYLSVYP